MTDPSTPPRPRARRLKAAGITFVPVPLARKRCDGWSAERQRDFLAALYACGVVATAARAVTMSAKSAYRLRKRHGAGSFAAAWDKLLGEARDRAYDMVIEAALTESFVPRTYRGLFVGAKTANNTRMMIAASRARPAPAHPDDGALHAFLNPPFPSGKGHE